MTDSTKTTLADLRLPDGPCSNCGSNTVHTLKCCNVCDHRRNATISDIFDVLRELGAERVEATDKYFGTAKHPIPYMKPGIYLVYRLEEQP